MAESTPALTESALQALSEPFSPTGSLSEIQPIPHCAADTDGFKVSCHYWLAREGQSWSQLLHVSVLSSGNPLPRVLMRTDLQTLRIVPGMWLVPESIRVSVTDKTMLP